MDRHWLGLLVAVGMGTQAAYAQEMEVVLRLKERVAMETLAEQVTNPRSPRYAKFYDPDEIRDLAAPLPSDYANFISQLKAKGLKLIGESKSHLYVTVSGDSQLFESLFSTKIDFLSTGKRHAHLSPQIPTDLAFVQSVTGLDTTRASRSHLRIGKILGPVKGVTVNGNQTDTPAGLTPAYIKTAYGFTGIYQAGYSGKGQHIAIASYNGFYVDDVQQYYAQVGISPAPTVDQVNFNGTAVYDESSAMETQVDAEFSGMIAPGSQIHVFTSSHNDDAGELQLFTAILDDGRAKVVNYSWGDCEAHVTQQHFQDLNSVFARAVAQGVNIMVASGDWGASGCPLILPKASRATQASPSVFHGVKDDLPSPLSADWPAANPYVVAVGGTTVNGGDNGAVQETGWESSGGGVSSQFPLPTWQKNFSSPYLKRSFPDVSFNADPNSGQAAWVHYSGKPTWAQIGGTSIAAPQWSGFMSLVGEARTGQSALGYLNPHIYGLSSAQYPETFHDITVGDNSGFLAGPGWDAVTGWGSMRAFELLDWLRRLQ